MEKLTGFDIRSTWEIEGGLHIGHILEKIGDLCEKSGALENEANEKETQVDDSYANTVVLRLPTNASEDLDCTLSITSSQATSDTLITGLSINSGAQYVEVHSQKQGYLGTGKGELVKSSSGGELYVKNVVFETPVPECTIKFLKFENKKQLKVHRIRAKTRGTSPSMTSGSINYDEVQSLLDEMGQTIPDRAKEMLESVRNYQQTHPGIAGASSMAQAGGGAAGMTGLLAMMSRMSTGGAVSATSPKQDITEGDLVNIMQGMMGGQNVDSPLMLDSLRNICGAVSKQRDLERTREPPVGEKDNLESGGGVTASSEVMSEVDKKMSAMETKIMTDVDEKLAGVESRIMNKLDLLLNVLGSKPQSENSSRTSGETGDKGGGDEIALD